MGTMSKKTKTTSNETVGPSAYAQPYIDPALQAQGQAYGDTMKLFNEYKPQLQQGIDYQSSVMNDHGTNPWLEGVIGAANRDTTDAVNSQFMDRFGSGYHAKALARQVGENENQYRFNDYYQGQQRRDNAAGNQAGLIQSLIGIPQGAAGNYGNSVGGLAGRYMTSNGTSTTKQSGGLLSDLLIAAAMRGGK